MICHDLHVHTNQSLCARPEATLDRYVPVMAHLGIRYLGLTDHFWDAKVPGSSSWYAKQGWDHVRPLKDRLALYVPPAGMKLYFGCETEYVGYGVMAVAEETAAEFDYILVPPDHFHMAGLTRPAGLKGTNWLRRLTLDRFHECCDLPLCSGIVHPFSLLLGFKDVEEEVLSGITDQQYTEAFRHAAENGKIVEVNSCVLESMGPKNSDGLPTEQIRLYTLGREAGCRFYYGSDAHSPLSCTAEKLAKVQKFLDTCGIVLEENPFALK